MLQSHCTIIEFPRRSVRTARSKAMPTRLKNLQYRSREYLTEDEVDRLIAAAGRVGRHGERDTTLLLLAYRHGLRVSELVGLRWEQIDFNQRLIHVRRLKRGTPSVHPLGESEVEALLRLQVGSEGRQIMFVSERGSVMSPDAVRKIITRAGMEAGFPFKVHPHMLRHACGYKLAQAGRDTRAIQHYLGHTNIQHTVRYTQLSAERFKDFWND